MTTFNSTSRTKTAIDPLSHFLWLEQALRLFIALSLFDMDKLKLNARRPLDCQPVMLRISTWVIDLGG